MNVVWFPFENSFICTLKQIQNTKFAQQSIKAQVLWAVNFSLTEGVSSPLLALQPMMNQRIFVRQRGKGREKIKLMPPEVQGDSSFHPMYRVTGPTTKKSQKFKSISNILPLKFQIDPDFLGLFWNMIRGLVTVKHSVWLSYSL